MSTEVKLPELGENLHQGEVLEVRVAVGAEVRKGQTLLEVEAEKATVEVPAPLSGRVADLQVRKGDQVAVGQTLCWIEAAGADGAAETPAPAAPVQEKKQPAPPSDQPAAVAEPAAPAKTMQLPDPAAPVAADSTAPVPAGPATRRLARELGVDLHKVPGSAPGGRVTPEDIKAFVRQLAAAPVGRGAVAVPALPDFERWGPIERQPLEPIRRRTAEQMSLSWSQVPHVTQHDQADITELDAFRKQQEGKGPRLTVTAFALKAVAIALRRFPMFNASLDAAAGQLILKRYYHLGVAVDTERGLLVPVLRDVERKTIYQLAEEVAALAERARQKKVNADELRGGTFTITNLGGIGGTGFSPIVNYPEVAILGLSRAQLLPRFRDSQVVPRLILPVSLSYDHRVIDGANAARFTRLICDMLEQPLQMLLHA